MIDCICIDDKNRPKEIPEEKWVKEEEGYKITHVYIHPNQGGIQGVTLYEKPLDESCPPYETFKLSRFAIRASDLEAFIELCKSCSDLNDVDVMKLVEESELQLAD